MTDAPKNWTRYFFSKRESLKTTWLFRLVLATTVLLLTAVLAFRVPGMARELVCQEGSQASEVILVENFGADYMVFKRASQLRRSGVAPKVMVPTETDPDSGQLDPVSVGIVEVMARVARLPELPQMVPITLVEPISLNAAYQIRAVLQKEHVRSVIVVSPGFRSRRSLLVYSAVFDEVGIATSCVPVFGSHTTANWTRTWHGIQEVVEQYMKLQYYRWYVLPNRKHGDH